MALPRSPGIVPLIIIVGIPYSAAFFAVFTFDAIPPVPSNVTESPAIDSMPLSISSTSGISFAPGFTTGSSVNSPSISERITSISASTRFVTRPDNKSLSPNLISSIATVSFSFITGITP